MDETKAPEDANQPTEDAAAAGSKPERRDEDGLPLDRAPTLDDVRGTEGSGRTIAVGCAILVALAVAAFWILRALVAR
jgi:hypothetical protein